jgi:hypothetical protein
MPTGYWKLKEAALDRTGENSLWKRLWTWLKMEYRMNEQMNDWMNDASLEEFLESVYGHRIDLEIFSHKKRFAGLISDKDKWSARAGYYRQALHGLSRPLQRCNRLTSCVGLMNARSSPPTPNTQHLRTLISWPIKEVCMVGRSCTTLRAPCLRFK